MIYFQKLGFDVVRKHFDNVQLTHKPEFVLAPWGAQSALEFQGYVTNAFTVPKTGSYHFECHAIHSHYVDNVLYFGNIYSKNIYGTVIHLRAGRHFWHARVRAKAQLNFRIRISEIQPALLTLVLGGLPKGNEVTDLLDGKLPFSETSWMQLPITTTGNDYIRTLSVHVSPLKASWSSSSGGPHKS
jgi:hypothetical protein